MNKIYMAAVCCFFMGNEIIAQNTSAKDSITLATNSLQKASTSKWYDKLNIRGYAQLRYNGLYETNEDLQCEQCDKSLGGVDDFFLRRMRIIFYGQISERVYLYVQPDFASTPDNKNLHFAQLRDAYFDIGIDKKNEYRVRLGQSKVPYGFENMQSSQNRLTLDRNDALNSAVSNERDLGAFFYWAPTKIRERFSYLVSSGLKGSGDYGVFAFGVYNGQVANKPEANNNKHIVARVSYPVELKTKNKQIVEAGVQAYAGKFVLTSLSGKAISSTANAEYKDNRIAGSVIVYPQPFGLQAEYTVGTGPRYDPAINTITQQDIKGGYVLASYMAKVAKHVIIPFAKYQFYSGGKKHETDARNYNVSEYEMGIEWQPMKAFEFTAMFTNAERRFEDGAKPSNFQQGNVLRLQAQVNF